MTSDTHGPSFSFFAGVMKRKRYSTAPFRQTPFKQKMNGVKGSRARYKKTITLPSTPFNHRDEA